MCECSEPPSIRSIRELFEDARSDGHFLKICAPMVRYSQLPFRLLTRKYGCDIAYSPMIVASSFAASEKARAIDFSTCPADRPLVVQFGASNCDELVNAASYVVRFADGIDVNCGCPQKWVIKEGLGSALLNDPELVRDMVIRLKNAFPSGQLGHDLTISIKIRIFKDEKRSVDFVQQLAKTGLDYMAIHGRTVAERSNDAPHWNIVSAVNDYALRPARIPLVANGALRNLDNAKEVVNMTGALGVMAAEQMLRNPAMFAGYNHTPSSCFADFITFAKPVANVDAEGDKGHNLKFDVYRKHITEMISGTGIYGRRNQNMKKFNSSKTGEEVNAWLMANMINNNNNLETNLNNDLIVEDCDPTTEIVSPSL